MGLIGGFSFIKPLVLLPLNKPASAAISFSLTSVRGAGTRRSFLGGEDVATVERELVGEDERVEGYDVEKSVTVAVPLLSWLS